MDRPRLVPFLLCLLTISAFGSALAVEWGNRYYVCEAFEPAPLSVAVDKAMRKANRERAEDGLPPLSVGTALGETGWDARPLPRVNSAGR